MGLFLNQGTFTAGGGASLSGLVDLELAFISGQWRLFSASQSTYGLGAFAVNGSGNLTALDSVNYGASSGTLGVAEIDIAVVGGASVLIPTGRFDNRIALHGLDSSGGFDTVSGPSGAPGAVTRIANLAISGKTFAFLAEQGVSGFSVYQITSGLGLTYASGRLDTATSYIGDITSMVTASAYSKSFLFAASGFDAGVTAYTVNASGQTTERGSAGVADGLGVAAPSDMATVMIGQDLFLILAGAQSDSLSVFQVSLYGQMTLSDHVFDTAEVFLRDITSVETVSLNGRTFVLAGGAEDGLSVFELMPKSGTLKFMDSIGDDATLALQDITDIEAAVINGVVHVYVSSSAETGITHLTLDLGTIQTPVLGTKHDDILNGSANNDLLMGFDRNDVLNGFNGNDRLVDGAGYDILNGGNGADVFCFVPDNTLDVIEDFTPGLDKIDLSEFPMLYSLDQIAITDHSWGVLLTIGRDRIQLLDNAAAGSIDLTDIYESDFIFA